MPERCGRARLTQDRCGKVFGPEVIVPVDRSVVPALRNIATRPADRVGARDVGGRQRSSLELLLGGRDHGGALLRSDAVRSQEPA